MATVTGQYNNETLTNVKDINFIIFRLMSKGLILIVDDEPDIREIISFNLSSEGYTVIESANGREAIELAKKHNPQLIILDVMMPVMNGINTCNLLRKQPQFQATIIIFLTALSDEKSEVAGLETGADDYLSKPVSPKLLVSKVNALFRRISNGENDKIKSGTDFTIDRTRYLVTCRGKDILLARKEFELLALLASAPGKVFLRHEILDRIWGADVIVGDRTIDVHIRKIRSKLGVDCITTVKGVGYKFDFPD